jgi:hypothetical protein
LRFAFEQRESEVNLHKATSLPESPSTKELMSIYKGTSMKLLLKKSDFSAVEFRL